MDFSGRIRPSEYFHFNAVGHTVATSNVAGTVQSSNLYEAYGGIVLSTGSSQNNRLANTKERDFSIGLDNHGFRYYDAEVGRYINPDPIGYADGMDIYLYVGDNPINRLDPHGLGETEEAARGRVFHEAMDEELKKTNPEGSVEKNARVDRLKPDGTTKNGRVDAQITAEAGDRFVEGGPGSATGVQQKLKDLQSLKDYKGTKTARLYEPYEVNSEIPGANSKMTYVEVTEAQLASVAEKAKSGKWSTAQVWEHLNVPARNLVGVITELRLY